MWAKLCVAGVNFVSEKRRPARGRIRAWRGGERIRSKKTKQDKTPRARTWKMPGSVHHLTTGLRPRIVISSGEEIISQIMTEVMVMTRVLVKHQGRLNLGH